MIFELMQRENSRQERTHFRNDPFGETNQYQIQSRKPDETIWNR